MLLDLLLPRRCVVCARPGTLACDPCLARMPRLAGVCCARCGSPTVWPVDRCRECSGRRIAFASARAAVAYDRAVRSFVTAWKERGLRSLAEPAGELVVATLDRPAEASVITYIPPDGDRTVRRGHHPAERLARELGARWNLPVVPLLGRTRVVHRQRGLSRAERRRNVGGAFVAASRVPTCIVLVDDVYTTGATASAAASALRGGGAERVEIVTFARAVR